MSAPQHLVASGRRWRKVLAPKKWHAADGEVLEGTYLGRKTKDGPYGPYQAIMVRDDATSEVRVLTGKIIVDLFDGAVIEEGAQVRVCFLGERLSKAGRSYQDYDLYVEERDSAAPRPGSGAA